MNAVLSAVIFMNANKTNPFNKIMKVVSMVRLMEENDQLAAKVSVIFITSAVALPKLKLQGPSHILLEDELLCVKLL